MRNKFRPTDDVHTIAHGNSNPVEYEKEESSAVQEPWKQIFVSSDLERFQ